MTLGDFGWLLLCVVIGVWSVVQSRQMFGFWFSPLSLYLGMNCFSLAGYHLRLLEMNDVSLMTHLVLLASLVLFVVGAYAGREGAPASAVAAGVPALDSRNLGLFFYLTAGLASVGWGVSILILVARHGLGALLANVWVLQDQFQMQFIGYLNMIGILVLPTFVLRVAGRTWRRLDLVFVAAAVFGLLLAGIKAYLVYSVLTSLIVWGAVRPDTFRVRYLLAGLVVLLLFFIIYMNMVDIFVVARLEAAPWFARFEALHMPYLYFVGSWPAFESVVAGALPEPPVIGTVVFQPFWKIAGDGLGLVDPVPFNLPFAHIGTTFFNVYSLVGEVYWDFGWPGVVIISLLLGFASTRLYLRVRRLAYWGHALAYGVVGYGLFLAGFIYSYRFNVLVMLVYLFVVGFVVCRGGVLRQEPAEAGTDG